MLRPITYASGLPLFAELVLDELGLALDRCGDGEVVVCQAAKEGAEEDASVKVVPFGSLEVRVREALARYHGRTAPPPFRDGRLVVCLDADGGPYFAAEMTPRSGHVLA